MEVKIFITVTDRKWFDNLRRKRDLAEVNWWSPSKKNFKALRPGEIYLFKLHRPDDYIVGGGVFVRAAGDLPCSLAWKVFGEGNGANSAEELRSMVSGYQKAESGGDGDRRIGCRVLAQPFFLDEGDWMKIPNDWSSNLLDKGYGTESGEGRRLWNDLRERISLFPGYGQIGHHADPHLIRTELGHGGFWVQTADAYDRQCAVTAERTLPALDASHIKPYAAGGPREPSNGLLLRSDLHDLFDAGYATVTKDMRFEVSRRIKEEYRNGRHYLELHGRSVRRPDRPAWRPDPAALEWHNERCFIA